MSKVYVSQDSSFAINIQYIVEMYYNGNNYCVVTVEDSSPTYLKVSDYRKLWELFVNQ